MLLKSLIKNISKDKKNIKISGLSINSKEVKKNYIFFAINGKKINGENFINEAIQNGASVVVCSENYNNKNKKIFFIKTKKPRYLLSEIASKFYEAKPKNIFAVTGTNGKTSVSDLFYQLFRSNNLPVASIGTLGIKYKNKIIKTDLTSPDTITLHKKLNYLKIKKIENVIIEASSHGLDQKRLHHIKFKGAIFTNFSQDHLDYHHNMKSYLNSKLILFREILKKKSKIISDGKIKEYKIIKQIAQRKKLKLIDIQKQNQQNQNIYIKLNDDFRVKNLAMAVEAAKLCGLKNKFILKGIKNLKEVNGRLELVKMFHDNVKVFVDYAHTPDALSKTIRFLKFKYGKNVSLVFGCGGERDQKKRSLMAKIANSNCKKIYVTDDNPRNEDPKKIRREILKNISKYKVFDIGNRGKAINQAIHDADPGDIILIAGKGHEEKQIYKNKIIKISDKKIINKIKRTKKIISSKKQNYLLNKLIFKKLFGKDKKINFHGISIDTRTIKKDNLFLALKGKKRDGNEFISNAIRKGARCIITSKKLKKKSKKITIIKSPISFLSDFAKLKREQSLACIIAVTGSAGKTSLKILIKKLLRNFGKTYSSPKSFNNYLGVPISLSNLSCEDKFGVFEVGMSKAGEIRNLTKLIKPHIGIITNIGEAHMENFKSINGIAAAKSEIIENIKVGGKIILNRDDKFFTYLYNKAKKYNLKICTFGFHNKSHIRVKKMIKKGKLLKAIIRSGKKNMVLEISDLNIYNVLASLAVLKELNISFNKVKNKFKNFDSPEGRGKEYSISRYKKKFQFIDESYNANPLSVKTAIDRLNSIKKHKKFKKYLILGDMLELGSKSEKYHKDLSKVINNSDIDKVFIKGNKTIFTYKYLNKDKRGNILQNNEDIDLSLGKIISNNDYLMIKGSNATGLNNISKKIIKGI